MPVATGATKASFADLKKRGKEKVRTKELKNKVV
jgi:hypothetical protein